ncbi:N-6 DNA methylase [Polaromonas eurypsychrophila]|uniref:N-6 DNA methylase n=1 Tax=Polaromonas eurypsychrophila TaxID=1614635 RepID=UPI00166E3B65|nr:N-6 DNA methylase [Polaromonas eurypsychrophila]
MERIEGSDRLGRYYTKETIGSLLVDQMDGLAPAKILDLGAGGGSLSLAAGGRWADAELLTVDVDGKASAKLRKLFSAHWGSRHSHIRADALSSDLPRLISAKASSIDAAVCNPPFITPAWRKGFGEILEDAGFSGCLPVMSDVDAALLFLAQNLRLLNETATLGIVLPDTLVSAKKYRRFREQLLKQYQLHRTIRLPRNSFTNTDAQAYIAVISKGNVTRSPVPLQRFDAHLGIQHELLVKVEDAIERLDFEYHAHHVQTPCEGASPISLGSICVQLQRGSLSSSERNGNPFPVLHTTDLISDARGCWIDLQKLGFRKKPVDARLTVAESGDILIGRVGRNLEDKVVGISRGTAVVTDCVYVLRVPKQYRIAVLAQLTSLEGKAWLASRAYGVSAKQLTKTDLLAFPVHI